MFAIAYNLLRLLMADAARLSSRQPHQISFKGAADTLRHYKGALWMVRKVPRKQKEVRLELLKTIAGSKQARENGRAKKRRPKNFDTLPTTPGNAGC